MDERDWPDDYERPERYPLTAEEQAAWVEEQAAWQAKNRKLIEDEANAKGLCETCRMGFTVVSPCPVCGDTTSVENPESR